MTAGWVHKTIDLDDLMMLVRVPLGSVLVGGSVNEETSEVYYRAKTSALEALRDSPGNGESWTLRYVDADTEVSLADMRRLTLVAAGYRHGDAKFLYKEDTDG